MKRLLIPDPGQPMRVAYPKDEGADRIELEWRDWPNDERLPDNARTEHGFAILSYAKPRPCLVLTHPLEIAAFNQALVLPISTVKVQSQEQLRLLRANQIPHRHLVPGEPNMGIQDGEVDFRWTWRLTERELMFGTHEAELEPGEMVRLLLRMRDYLYTEPR